MAGNPHASQAVVAAKAGEIRRPVYRWYVLGVLTAIYALNTVDRNLMALLLQPIKTDLHLSDTQLGFLTGIAFALFYATLGLPIARWADRGNRVTIASMAIGLWALTVMSCLFVVNYVQLVFARIAAAVGESGCMPPTYALVGDYFPKPAERPRAMAVYMLSNGFSFIISFIAGGWLNERYGWRMTFFLMGIPGLILAILTKLTVAEPAEQERQARSTAPPLRLMPVLRVLWRQQSSRHLIIGLVLLFLWSLGMVPWYAAFLIRTHGMGTAELGLWLGLVGGPSGMTSIMLGGFVAGKWLANNERQQMRLCAVMIVGVIPCFALFLLLPGKHQAALAFAPLAFTFNFFNGPVFALLQRLVPDDMRATTLAIVMLLSNLIGMGIGPQIVGILSDLLTPSLGNDSLRYAMLSMSFLAAWAAYHFWCVGRTVAADLSSPALHG